MANKASASTTLVIVPEIGTFNPYMICDKGDLWQRYKGPVANPTTVVPDYTQNPPLVSLVVTSSRNGGFEEPDEVAFYMNSVLIGSMIKSGNTYTKSANTAAAYVGMFELLDPTENSGCYGFRIKKNIVAVTNGGSGRFRAVFTVSNSTNSASLESSLAYNISEVTDNSRLVVIEAGDNYNFQITKNNNSVKLAAKYYEGTSEITSGITYKWYREKTGAGTGDLLNWELIAGATTAVLTVTEADVDTAHRYMVHVCDSSGGTVLGQDTQMVYDNSDLYDVSVSREPSDGQTHKAGDKVTVTCAPYRRDNSTVIDPTTCAWTFNGMTPGGMLIFSRSNATGVCEVSFEDIQKAGGQLEMTIIASF